MLTDVDAPTMLREDYRRTEEAEAEASVSP